MTLSIALLGACTRPDPTSPAPEDTDTAGTPIVDSTAPPDPTGDTAAPPAPTGDTGTPIDCSVAPQPTLVRYHDYIPSSEDFTFDDEGYLWGVTWLNSALVRTPLDGAPELLLPDVSTWGRGIRFLPDRDLVLAEPDQGVLLRIDRDTFGTNVVIGGLNQPNGVAIDDDGKVYLTQATGEVLRVDPATGDQDLVYATPVSTDGVTLAPDYDRLYWNSENGQIVTAVIDDAGTITEAANLFTEIPIGAGAGFGILDGMTADACGNLYVVQMSGHIIRIQPDGTQTEIADLTGMAAGTFISAANFGSGVGGWERDHLYVMSLMEGLFEIDVGIEGKWEPHLPTP